MGDAWVRGLSGGEKKRASIACEMIMDPPIIFMDVSQQQISLEYWLGRGCGLQQCFPVRTNTMLNRKLSK